MGRAGIVHSLQFTGLINLITYPLLSAFKEVTHFTTTRQGGVSEGSYASLNLGLYSGDKPENIKENFSHLGNFTKINPEKIFLPYQTHGDEVLVIDSDFLEKNKSEQQIELHGKDALISNQPNVYMGVSTADCVPILLYDPVQKAVAAVHAGWRGTAQLIAGQAIRQMTNAFGCKPENLVGVIGPSISPAVYEVGEELIRPFGTNGFIIDRIFRHSEGKIQLDLWQANEDVLVRYGMRQENIEIACRCTFSEQDTFFSARRLGIKSGRMISVIGMGR